MGGISVKPRDQKRKAQREGLKALERETFFVLGLDPPMALDLTAIIVGYFEKAWKAEDDLLGSKETWESVVNQILNRLVAEGYCTDNGFTEKFWAYLRAKGACM